MFKALNAIFHRKNKPQPGDLLFDTADSAFLHACKYTNLTRGQSNHVLAIVLDDSDDGQYALKVARLTKSGVLADENLVRSQPMTDMAIGNIRRGDLVLYQPPAAMRDSSGANGIIVDKVRPVFRPAENRWLSALQ